MKTTIQLILVAAVLATTSAPVTAATEAPAANNNATSVADMMQKKREHKLRAQLVAAGRLTEVRQMDENNAIQTLETQDNRYAQANAAISRGSNARGLGHDQWLIDCEPEKLREN